MVLINTGIVHQLQADFDSLLPFCINNNPFKMGVFDNGELTSIKKLIEKWEPISLSIEYLPFKTVVQDLVYLLEQYVSFYSDPHIAYIQKKKINAFIPIYENDFQKQEYYNLIRNSQAHVFDDTKKLSNAYSDLTVQLESAPTFVCEKLNAPSAPDNICFDDFILFSRATKELAQRFFKSIDYDEQKVANSIQLNRFSYLKNNKDRLCNKIKTELRDKYGISEESLDHIIDIVVKKIYND